MPARLIWLHLLAWPVAQQAAQDVPILRSGGTIEGEIADGDPEVHTELLTATYTQAPTVAKTFLIELEENGSYSFELRSHHFDAYLILRDNEGSVLFEDDDGLIGVHSRIVAMELEAGVHYLLQACALHGKRGSFALRVAPGLPPGQTLRERRRLELEDLELRVREIENHAPGTLALMNALHDRSEALRDEGAYAEAERLCRRYLELAEELTGHESSAATHALSDLAILLGKQGRYDEARLLHARALGIREQALGPEHLDVATPLNNLALLLLKQGLYDEAHPLFERALAIREDSLGPEHPLTAQSMHNLALLLMTQGLYDDARPLCERALAVREKALGPEHPEVANSLSSLAELLKEQGLYDKARPLYERALAIREETLGPKHPDLAISLNNLALLLKMQGLYDEARPLYERALAVFEETLGPEHPWTARGLDNLALLLKSQGHYNEARPLYERALAISEKTLGPEHPDVATGLNNLAVLLKKQGQYAEARPLYERALAICEEALGPEHPRTAKALNNLAVLLKLQGQYDEARPLYERALAICENTLGPDHHSTATGLHSLALLLEAKGLYDEARPLYERALSIYENTLGPEHPEVASGLNSLGKLLSVQGRYEEARPLHERALAIKEEAFGPDHPAVATSLNELAVTLISQGLYSEARSLCKRALAIYEKSFGPEHREIATSLNNLAVLLWNQGMYDEARPLYERSIAIQEQTLGPEHPTVATSLNNLAESLRKLGLYDEARPLFERALTIREKALGPEHPATVTSLNGLALLFVDLGHQVDAWRLVRRSSRGRTAHLVRVLASQGEHECYTYLARFLRHLELSLSMAKSADSDHGAIKAYEELLAWKGQVARLQRSSRSRLQRDLTAEQTRILTDLRGSQSELSALALAGGTSDRNVRDKNLSELRKRRAELELEWIRSLEHTEPEDVSFESVSSNLPPASALVDFFVHRHRTAARRDERTVVELGFWSEPHLNVWISRPGDERPVNLDLGSAAIIGKNVKVFLEALTARRGISTVRRESVDVGAKILNLLWDPLAEHLDGVETIIVSPDGFLGTLPFEVLQAADGQFLVEKHAFVYVEDPASLARIEDRDAPRFDTLVSVGAVDFRRRTATKESEEVGPKHPVASASRALRGGFDFWESLPATAGESQAVLEMHEDAYESGRRIHLTGESCTEESLKDELPRHAVSHIATHGFFQPEGMPNMWEDALNAAGDREMQMREPARRLVGDHPGLLSGLVCAGANADLEAGRDDGYLTAEEVGWLDLSGVELVVLSACETGLGRARSGEGLIGLRRAFRTAGANTVISSLWSVRDESTADLMRAFYRNLWVRKMGKLEALRAAQLDMLKKNRIEHSGPLPSTWGAFVLSGNWR